MKTTLLVVTGVSLLVAPAPAGAHCDTLDGPVVADARTALEAGDVTPVLKWVEAAREAEIRRAFEQALRVRPLGPEARALSDRFFFETLVRVHRAGEGAPYTGLKPAGAAASPAIAAADAALESGAVEPLVEQLLHRVEHGLRERHARAIAARAHAGESVSRGRAYVAAYVELMHYAERVLAAAAPVPHAPEAAHGH